MRKTIVFGVFLSIFLMMVVPNVNAIEFQQVKAAKKSVTIPDVDLISSPSFSKHFVFLLKLIVNNQFDQISVPVVSNVIDAEQVIIEDIQTFSNKLAENILQINSKVLPKDFDPVAFVLALSLAFVSLFFWPIAAFFGAIIYAVGQEFNSARLMEAGENLMILPITVFHWVYEENS